MRPASLVLASLPLCTGCVTLAWERDARYREPAPAATTQISIGESTLEDCLGRLGAPLLAEEYGKGMALYWGWTHERNWGISVRIPLPNNASTSVRYSDVNLDLNGLLLAFDENLRVELFQFGRLQDLLGAVERQRPQLLEEAEPPK
jgi:hypothetical protein